MRRIDVKIIKKAVSQLCIQANVYIKKDVLAALKQAYRLEKNKIARRILESIIENARIAKKESLPLCQDTGIAIVLAEVGQEVEFFGGNLKRAIQEGIRAGYKKGYLRNSVIGEPLKTGGSPQFGPGVIHFDLLPGNKVRLTVLAKGFGSENKGRMRMFKTTEVPSAIEDFIVEAVKEAGADACPPYIVGVGIGGTQDEAALLAKRALLRPLNRPHPEGYIAKMERSLKKRIDRLGIGPMGLGGRTTALGVNIETHPCHIAGIPVAANISCHSLRSATKTL